MAHAPAICFQLEERGFLREGYYADIVIVNPNKSQVVSNEKVLYACAWTPFDGTHFSNTVASTYVNGIQVYDGEKICSDERGMRLTFNR